MTTDLIGIPVDHRGAIRGAAEMLRESARQFRQLNQPGHAGMADAHALRLELALRAMEHGNTI